MRWVAVLALVVGCRLNFDASTDDANGDGPPIPTCMGHDEDGDGFPDACDVCPTVPDPLQLDRGELLAGNPADGVGDACDPRPALGGDYIQLFEAMTNSASTTFAPNGPVSYQADALRVGSTTMAAQGDYQLPALPTRIEARMRVIAASTTMTQWFGIWYSQDIASTTKVIAQAADTPNDGVDVELNLDEDNMSVRRASVYLYGPAPRFAAGDTYTMVVETSLATGGDDVMYVTDPLGNTRTTSLAVQIPLDVRGFLEAMATQIDFEYFIAYAIR